MNPIYNNYSNSYFSENFVERTECGNNLLTRNVYYQKKEDMNQLFEKIVVTFNCGTEIEIRISDSLHIPGSKFKMVSCLNCNGQQYHCNYQLINGEIQPIDKSLGDYPVKTENIDKKLELCQGIIRDKSRIIQNQRFRS